MSSDKILPEGTTKPITHLGSKESIKTEQSNEPILGLNSKELKISKEDELNEEGSGSMKINANLTKVYVILTFIVAFSIFIFAASVNPEVFKLEESTSRLLNQAVNAVVLLVIPFLFGAVGGLTRILLTDLVIKQKGMLIISSGLMAIFSWVAIKSDLLFSSPTPALNMGDENLMQLFSAQEISSFYSASLIAIIVGVLATNFYISLVARVELQLARSAAEKNAE